MKKLISSIVIVLTLSILVSAQVEKIIETEFKVFGVCGMCKSRIEKAMKIKQVKSAKWNKETKMLNVAYVENAITVDDLHKIVAKVGHDTEKFKAADSVYAKLPKCCLYRDNPLTH